LDVIILDFYQKKIDLRLLSSFRVFLSRTQAQHLPKNIYVGLYRVISAV